MTQPTDNAQVRKDLEDRLRQCQRRVLDEDRYGTITGREAAEAERVEAMAALVAFNLRTIRMVPVTHLRR